MSLNDKRLATRTVTAPIAPAAVERVVGHYDHVTPKSYSPNVPT